METVGILVFTSILAFTIFNGYFFIWKQKRYTVYSMSLFYLIMVGILLTRLTQFIMILTGMPFYYYAVFLLGQISAIFDIYLGIIHCYNLSSLWVMLRKMRESLTNNAKTA